MIELLFSEPTLDRDFLPVLCFVSAIPEVDNGDKIIGVNLTADVNIKR
jgi:hypothetical protein